MRKPCSIPGMSFKELYKRILDREPYSNKLYNRKDDLSLSRLFADITSDILKYNVTAKEFDYYDGRRYARDTGSMVVENLMKTFIRIF